MRGLSHIDYFNDRQSEYELCRDFPGDEILIDGLHAMQCHFNNNGIYIDIPVVRVMNTAHYLAAYMFATTCSGDQMEYDALADMSLGRDKQMFRVAMIVLAAMLARTEGFRARNCRNLILDNRDPDFDEGVTLYDRFLRSAEKRFNEEDFLIDTQQLITQLHEKDQLITQQASTILQLQYTISTMNQQNNQYNITYNGPVYNAPVTNTTNNYYPAPSPDQAKDIPTDEVAPIPDSIIFTKKAKAEGKQSAILQALQKSVEGRRDKTRAFVQELQTWQHDDYVDRHFNAQVMYAELNKMIPLSFGYDVFKRYYNNSRN